MNHAAYVEAYDAAINVVDMLNAWMANHKRPFTREQLEAWDRDWAITRRYVDQVADAPEVD